MNSKQTCPICNDSNCNCSKAIITFFKLLIAVDQRENNSVLTGKIASDCLSSYVISAGVDKLEGVFKHPLHFDYIISRLNEFSLKYKLEVLKDKKRYLKVYVNDAFLHIRLNFERTHFSHLVSNPNHFLKWDNYNDALYKVMGESFKEISLSRVDLNLDFATDIKKLIASLDFKNKQSEVSFSSKSGNITGIQVGKDNEIIKVYDKSGESENKANIQISRLEKSLKNEKLPVRNILELPSFLQNNTYFDNVLGVNIAFSGETLSEKQLEKLNEFKVILFREGYFSARKNFNKDRNFDRDFKNLISIANWAIQPPELFKRHINDFFNVIKEKIWMTH